MSRRRDLVKIIQDLSHKESLTQPSADNWLESEDDKARARRERDYESPRENDYQADEHAGKI